MLLVPAGRLGDARNRRGVFAIGLAVFTLASAACGAAPSSIWLVVFRVVQGLAAGIVSPQVSGFLQTMFRGKERAKAFGLFGMTVGISTAVGPLLGGLLVTTGGADGWRWVFLVNVPVGLVALALVRAVAAEEPAASAADASTRSGCSSSPSRSCLRLLPLVEGEQSSLSSRPWWLLVPSVGAARRVRLLGEALEEAREGRR